MLKAPTSPAAVAAVGGGSQFAGGLQFIVEPKPFNQRWINCEKGDAKKGRERYDATMAWRKEKGIDGLLHEPQKYFHFIKSIYKHGYHFHDRLNNRVYYVQCSESTAFCIRGCYWIPRLLGLLLLHACDPMACHSGVDSLTGCHL
jgi:hypothetical protein